MCRCSHIGWLHSDLLHDRCFLLTWHMLHVKWLQFVCVTWHAFPSSCYMCFLVLDCYIMCFFMVHIMFFFVLHDVLVFFMLHMLLSTTWHILVLYDMCSFMLHGLCFLVLQGVSLTLHNTKLTEVLSVAWNCFLALCTCAACYMTCKFSWHICEKFLYCFLLSFICSLFFKSAVFVYFKLFSKHCQWTNVEIFSLVTI